MLILVIKPLYTYRNKDKLIILISKNNYSNTNINDSHEPTVI